MESLAAKVVTSSRNNAAAFLCYGLVDTEQSSQSIAVTRSNVVYMRGDNNNSSMGGLGTRTIPTQLTTLDGKNIIFFHF